MAEIDEKSKAATLRHMNVDHQLDLGLYLRHINGFSAEKLAAEGVPEMVDMDLQSMSIRTATTGTVHVVPLTPPLASWGERRTRLVSLALEAREAFGVPLPEHSEAEKAAASSGTTPTPIPFIAPRGFHLVVFGLVVQYALCVGLVLAGKDDVLANAWGRAMVALGLPPVPNPAGSWAAQNLAGPDGFRRAVRTLALPVLAIHSTEVLVFALTRLARQKMSLTSRDSLLWLGSTFWEGVCAYERFDKAAAKAAKAEKK